MQVDGVAPFPAHREVVALEELAHSEVGGEVDKVGEGELAQPVGVVADDGAFRVQHLEGLLSVRPRVGLQLLGSQHGARALLVAGVADQAGEVADEEGRLVPQVLELAQLAHGHRVPQGEVGG